MPVASRRCRMPDRALSDTTRLSAPSRLKPSSNQPACRFVRLMPLLTSQPTNLDRRREGVARFRACSAGSEPAASCPGVAFDPDEPCFVSASTGLPESLCPLLVARAIPGGWQAARAALWSVAVKIARVHCSEARRELFDCSATACPLRRGLRPVCESASTVSSIRPASCFCRSPLPAASCR